MSPDPKDKNGLPFILASRLLSFFMADTCQNRKIELRCVFDTRSMVLFSCLISSKLLMRI